MRRPTWCRRHLRHSTRGSRWPRTLLAEQSAYQDKEVEASRSHAFDQLSLGSPGAAIERPGQDAGFADEATVAQEYGELKSQLSIEYGSNPNQRDQYRAGKADWVSTVTARVNTKTPESMTYAGLGVAEARRRADRLGVKMVRIIDGLEDTITFDFREYRLNLLVVEGVVSRAAFF